ncbi:MAG: YggS family pyridoxal phosphate-dependent enzyme [Saprospirales bacterium]|nr:MAG: YggS family pyridoxal phosphate-dependent enzyme [Saprospirales bacterium]
MINEEKYKELKAYCAARNIELIAVSKKQPNEKIQYLYDLGHRDFGENRVEELQNKCHLFPDDIRWHFIGHLQSKKVKLFEPIPYLIHSVDRHKLLEVLDKEGAKRDQKINILIQVKIAKEDSKYGFTFKEAEKTIDNLIKEDQYSHLALKGVMAMATFTDNEGQVQSEFISLAKFMVEMRKKHTDSPKSLEVLSIGMSNDYSIAADAGGNMVRIGSAIFGPRKYD